MTDSFGFPPNEKPINEKKPREFFGINKNVRWNDGNIIVGVVVYKGNQARDGIIESNAVAIFKNQDTARDFIFGYDAICAERDRLRKALVNAKRAMTIAENSIQKHRDKGHNDTCSYALDESLECDCGLYAARPAVKAIYESVAEIEKLKGEGE